MFKNLIRALRLPFISASILPFIFGSLIIRKNFNFKGFLLGLIAVMATHLSANLINDYADSKSGADWQDKRFYGFFGGSKLIQENKLSEKFYLKAALIFAGISFASVIAMSFLFNSAFIILIYTAIIFLSWSYSHGPLKFSYHRLGEIFIFILFGPALVMGGYFIQTGIFPDFKSFLLSLPFGFFTTAILFANEVPDCSGDTKAGKFTWVNILGSKYSFILYYIITLLGFLTIAINIYLGYLGVLALFCFVFIFMAARAGMVLKKDFAQKEKLINSSRLTISMQALVSVILILDLIV